MKGRASGAARQRAPFRARPLANEAPACLPGFRTLFAWADARRRRRRPGAEPVVARSVAVGAVLAVCTGFTFLLYAAAREAHARR